MNIHFFQQVIIDPEGNSPIIDTIKPVKSTVKPAVAFSTYAPRLSSIYPTTAKPTRRPVKATGMPDVTASIQKVPPNPEKTDSVTNPTAIAQNPTGSRIEQKTCSLAIAVEYQGGNVPGARINFSSSDGGFMRSCTTSEVMSQCSMTTQTCDGPFLVTVVVPEGSGYSCQDSGCTAIFTLIPEKTTEYTFVLFQEQAKGTVSVTTNSGECISGTVVEVSDSKNPGVILERMKTTSSE